MSDKPVSSGREDRDDTDSPVIGYMCLTDFRWELGQNMRGNTIYPTLEDCQKDRGCVAECGIVEVEIRARRIAQDPQKTEASRLLD